MLWLQKVNNSIILFLTVCFSIMGCSLKTATVSFEGNLGKGILYQEKMYWETQEIDSFQAEKKIGKVNGVEKVGVFPEKGFKVTNAAATYRGENIYLDGERIYVGKGDRFGVFEYLTQMDLGEEVSLNSETRVEGMAIPHLVYKNMRYVLNSELSVEEIPGSFAEAGEIIKTYTRAVENNTGNLEIGTKFYVSEFQNRYLIVQNSDHSYSVFENEGYKK